MKRYFFHVGGDCLEIQDNEGVLLPENDDLAAFCRRMILEVAAEEEWCDDHSDVRTVTVFDIDGNEVLSVAVDEMRAELAAELTDDDLPAFLERQTTH